MRHDEGERRSSLAAGCRVHIPAEAHRDPQYRVHPLAAVAMRLAGPPVRCLRIVPRIVRSTRQRLHYDANEPPGTDPGKRSVSDTGNLGSPPRRNMSRAVSRSGSLHLTNLRDYQKDRRQTSPSVAVGKEGVDGSSSSEAAYRDLGAGV